MTTHSIPQPHPQIPDLVSRTAPLRAVTARLELEPRPRGAHRAARRRVNALPHLTVLALGGVLAACIHLPGGPW